MKNSLFKRALAAVSTVPLALTQCLTVANAAYFSDTALSLSEDAKAAEARTITLTGEGGLLYIDPTNNGVYDYVDVTANYPDEEVPKDGSVIVLEKYSNWNEVAWTAIEKLKGKTGDVDLTEAYDQIISRAGNYKDVVAGIADHMSDVHYEVADNGDILLSADLSNITPVLTADLQGAIGEGMQKIADTYGLPVLEEPQIFDDIIIAGQFNGVIHSSSLNGGTSVSGEVSFTDSDGRVFKGAGMADYVIEKISALKQRAKDTVEEHKNEVEEIEEVYKDIDDSFSFILDNLARGKSAFNKAYDHVNDYDRTATDVADAIQQAKDFLTNSSKVKEFLNSERGQKILNSSYAQKILGGQSFEQYVNSLPSNAQGFVAKAMEYDRVNSIYGKILDKFNQEMADIIAVDIQMPEVGVEADRLTNLEATLNGHVATGYAEYPDDEIEEVTEYLATLYPDYDVVSSIKEAEVTVDFDEIKGNLDGAGKAGSAEGNLDYKRVVVLEKKVPEETTTTTTDETTTSTDTETTTTESETTDSETSTTDTTETADTDTDTTETTETTDTADTTDTETTGTDTTETTDSETSTTDTTDTETTGTDTTETTDSETSATDTDTTETVDTDTTETTDSETSTTDTETTVSDDTTTSTDTGTVTQEPGSGTTDTGTDPIDTGDATGSYSTTSTTDTQTTASTEPGETKTVVTTAVNYYAETEAGFYLNIDEEFNKEQIISLSYSIDEITEYYDMDDNLLSYEVTKEGEKHDIIDRVTFGDKTPNNTYEEGNLEHAYQIPLIATEPIVDSETGFVVAENAGDALTYVDGQEVTVTVYIGVKGDANLDNMVDAGDASDILSWYATMSTSSEANKTETNIFARNCALVKDGTDILDHFAAFLCDVNNEPGVVEDNWKLRKVKREVDATDASSVLAYYALISTGEEGGRPTWNKTNGVPHTDEPAE